ncbi:MAG TPA: sugar transferase [Ignavibacteria bacterium]|nr:sugar transferase [Ignavibacteria bacterium]
MALNRDDVTFSDSVLLDLYYADNQSLWLDLKILFKTIPVMVFGKGGV